MRGMLLIIKQKCKLGLLKAFENKSNNSAAFTDEPRKSYTSIKCSTACAPSHVCTYKNRRARSVAVTTKAHGSYTESDW
jgi:hypothetical protein